MRKGGPFVGELDLDPTDLAADRFTVVASDRRHRFDHHHLAEGDSLLADELRKIHETGKRSDRPELAKAPALCRKHKAKLVIAKLDRLSRNLAFIATMMDSARMATKDRSVLSNFLGVRTRRSSIGAPLKYPPLKFQYPPLNGCRSVAPVPKSQSAGLIA
jgi:hypothetical protein